MNLKIAIIAGGLGTRIHPLTSTTPKSLIMINGHPFIHWQLELLASQGFESVVLCLGHQAQQIIDFVGNGDRYGLRIEYSIEKLSLGTGGALKNAEALLGDEFGVLYGDSYLPINYKYVINALFSTNQLGIMTIYRNENRFDRSNILLDSNGEIKYSKKTPRPEMNYVDYGFTVLRRQALLQFKKGVKFDLGDLLEDLSLNDQIASYEVSDRFYEVGSFEGIVDLQKYLESGTR